MEPTSGVLAGMSSFRVILSLDVRGEGSHRQMIVVRGIRLASRCPTEQEPACERDLEMENVKEEGNDILLDELDIEVFTKENPEGRKKPSARFYIIRIDREKRRVSEPSLTGAQILALVNKTPQSHKLFQKLRGGETRVIESDEVVSFIDPGVERFQTIPKDTTEGAAVA